MHLLVGLGNPGPEHAAQRHNVGFMAADAIVRRHGFSPWRKKFQGELSEGSVGGVKVAVLKPATYMNLSGQSASAASQFYKIDLPDVIAIHDELDLKFGKLRVKRGGGAAGHNGLRSLDQHIGQNYLRLRMGIDHPGEKHLVTNYVLGNFSKAERAFVETWCDAIADALPTLVKGDEAGFMNKVHLLAPAPDIPAPGAASKKE
ncbi:MAG TPA: aminoacyl-tRNA hydrolase [Alphaproteobacteria bacterium]|jgi:PTH1 family peptidyl-tRNA hydrolase